MTNNRPGNRQKRWLSLVLFVFAGAVILALILLQASKKMVSVSRTSIEMGTAVSLTLHGRKGIRSESSIRDAFNNQINLIFDEINILDEDVLSWRSEKSEVSAINAAKSGQPVSVSDDLRDALIRSLDLAERSGGAFDITLRPVIDLWGIETHENGKPYFPPHDTEIRESASLIGMNHLRLNGNTLTKDEDGVQLDFGAVGKGFALDAALDDLQLNRKVSGSVLAAGGSILVYGSKGEPFQIGIRDPEGSPSDILGILTVPGEMGQTVFVSTSGGYEKYAEANGTIYEHIIDGRTLYPAESGLYSATVITHDSGLISDGLSTACYILGPEASQELLDHYKAEAIYVYRDRSVLLSDSLSEHFSLTNPAYHIRKQGADE